MLKIIITLGALVLFVGCQTMPYQPYARDVKKKPNQNGIIALKLEHRDEDRQKAQAMMSSNCGSAGVKVLEEGEVVIGQEAVTKSNTSYSKGQNTTQVGTFFGMPVVSGGEDPSNSTNSRVSTTQVKEWQISYECAGQKSIKK